VDYEIEGKEKKIAMEINYLRKRAKLSRMNRIRNYEVRRMGNKESIIE
jgi:hypothetical protein